jgi:hypothetical protein
MPKRYTFHKLRHDHASILVKQNVASRVAQHRMRHATPIQHHARIYLPARRIRRYVRCVAGGSGLDREGARRVTWLSTESELDSGGAGNGARTRDLDFGKYTTAVFCGRLMSTPSWFDGELSSSVRRCPCVTVVKTVVKTTFYHGKVAVRGLLPRFSQVSR